MTFDLSKHVRFYGANEYALDQNGAIKKDYKFDSEEILQELKQEKIVKAVVEQIIHIPEVQQLILQANEIAPSRFLNAHEAYGTEIPNDLRLTIDIDASNSKIASYSASTHTLSLGVEDIARSYYKSAGYGQKPISLQHAIIHELYHAGDPNDTPDDL